MIRGPQAPPRRSSRLRVLGAAAAIAVALLAASPVRADQQGEFAKGQQLYANGDHVAADSFFAKAIDGAVPTITDPALVAKGRMIRGAADMYLGRKADAVTQFEQILRASAKFEPDPLAFPPGVLDEFRKTRERLEKEAIAKAAGDKTTKELRACRASLDELGARYAALKTFAGDEQVVTTHSRVIASLPFGIGQFQNGDTTLGVLFLTTETIALATAAISYGIHESIPRQPADVDKARSAESQSRIINLIGVSAFVALFGGGIAQAHIAFVPDERETRPRALPKTFVRLEPVFAPLVGGATFGLAGSF